MLSNPEYTFILEKIHKVLPKALRGNSCTCVTDSVDPLVDNLMDFLKGKHSILIKPVDPPTPLGTFRNKNVNFGQI